MPSVAFARDATILSVLEEVKALPPKSRAKWHKYVKTIEGVKRRLRFIDGQLVFKDKGRWLALTGREDERVWETLEFADIDDEEEFNRLDIAYERGGFVEEVVEHAQMVAEHATGNHTSKPHKVRVPTKAGEPVRA